MWMYFSSSAADECTYSIMGFFYCLLVFDDFLSFHCLIVQPQGSFRGMSINHTLGQMHTLARTKGGKQTETTSAVWGHYLFNVIYKQLQSGIVWLPHRKHLGSTKEERKIIHRYACVCLCVLIEKREWRHRKMRRERETRRKDGERGWRIESKEKNKEKHIGHCSVLFILSYSAIKNTESPLPPPPKKEKKQL